MGDLQRFLQRSIQKPKPTLITKMYLPKHTPSRPHPSSPFSTICKRVTGDRPEPLKGGVIGTAHFLF